MPRGSNKTAQHQIYEFSQDQTQWLCTGLEKTFGFESSSGGVVVLDSMSVEQKWSRIIPDPNNVATLEGTWELQQYCSEQDPDWHDYPSFVRYLKLITPSHFFWVKYNRQFDEVMASGGGPYVYSGEDSYIEKIESFYPNGSDQVGTEISFELQLEDQAWKHRGYIKRVDRNSVIDSALVDEIWVRFAQTYREE